MPTPSREYSLKAVGVAGPQIALRFSGAAPAGPVSAKTMRIATEARIDLAPSIDSGRKHVLLLAAVWKL